MVLNNELLVDHSGMVKSNYRNYTLLATGHYDFKADKNVFEEGVQIWNLCNCIRIANKFLLKSKISKPIDYCILYSVLEAIETDKPFSDDELKDYLVFNQKMEQLCKGLGAIAPSYVEVMFIDSATDLTLIGYSKDKQNKFQQLNDEAWDEAVDNMFRLKIDALKGKIPLDKYKPRVLEMLEIEYKAAIKESNK